jgi:hypothetical protein
MLVFPMSLERPSPLAYPRMNFAPRPHALHDTPAAQIRHLCTPRANPSRINTSVKSSFFIKSLIMNDLKSIRISNRDNKSPRINTSETCNCKSLRINTSKKHPGEGVGSPSAQLICYLEFLRRP